MSETLGVQVAFETLENKPMDLQHFASLEEVVHVVELVLTEVKDAIANDGLQLQSAEFDFQTVVSANSTGGIASSILTVEGEHERESTTEMAFTYAVPDEKKSQELAIKPLFLSKWGEAIKKFFEKLSKTQADTKLNEALPAAIKAAAESVKAVRQINNPNGKPLTERTFTVSIAFAVKNAFNFGCDASSLIKVSPELKYSKSRQNVQTIKLTFVDSEKPAA
jgi:hypothetical protein